MSKINLRDYYPFYTSDCFIEVSDELVVFLEGCEKAENAYQRKKYRYNAHYSLDRRDGIEHDILFVSFTPEELYERKLTTEQLHAAIGNLPDKQAKRIYAHYFMGMSKTAIAKAEHVTEGTVRESILRGLKNIAQKCQGI